MSTLESYQIDDYSTYVAKTVAYVKKLVVLNTSLELIEQTDLQNIEATVRSILKELYYKSNFIIKI